MPAILRRARRSFAWRLRGLAIAIAPHGEFDAKVVEPEFDESLPPVSQSDVLDFCRRLSPFEVQGHRKARLGGKNDGGYVFIDDFKDISTVISCGISNDVSCDLAFAELGKHVVQFDHTVHGPPVPHERFAFRRQAIDELREIPGSVRLSDVIRKLGDRTKSDLLLKIDIEGHEWATFANMRGTDLKRCRQIACEFHSSEKLADPAHLSLYAKAIATISEGFFPAHVHANNFMGFASVMGVALPEVFEVTFVNKDFYRPGARQSVGPLDVDAPNDEGAPDIYLGSPFMLRSD